MHRVVYTHDMGTWKLLKWNELEKAPPTSGVYVLYEGLHPVYVGQSVNLLGRLRQHAGQLQKQNGKANDGVLPQTTRSEDLSLKYKVCRRDGEWLALEYRLIKKLRPKNNRTIIARSGQRKRVTEEVLSGGWVAKPKSRKWSPETYRSHRRTKVFLKTYNTTRGTFDEKMAAAQLAASKTE